MSKIERLIQILESLRRVHHYECEDGFYSCPAHPDYFGNDSSRQCNCGLWKDNENVDEALQIVRGLTLRAVDKWRARATTAHEMRNMPNKITIEIEALDYTVNARDVAEALRAHFPNMPTIVKEIRTVDYLRMKQQLEGEQL